MAPGNTLGSSLQLFLSTMLQEELEVPYEIKFYSRNSMMLAPKELSDVHPLGKSPVITDGDVTLAESGAIIGELVPLLPTSSLYSIAS